MNATLCAKRNWIVNRDVFFEYLSNEQTFGSSVNGLYEECLASSVLVVHEVPHTSARNWVRDDSSPHLLSLPHFSRQSVVVVVVFSTNQLRQKFFKNSPFIRQAITQNQRPKISQKEWFQNGVDPVQDSSFLDENGVVQDMDGYLNYLSLEYDSVWDTKPSWCQPWTIALTGIGIITCSWLVLHSLIVSGLVGAFICAWWYIFLYAYPKAYSDMIAERRKNVTSGVEDTYGIKTEQ
ncbi:uncharacterized protein [Primulina eburnea]|uniref:uncharacterized protein n=1 Tax=Primulina eburnea TaxID=1245227 RepID=UPI003C6C8E90